MGCTRMNITQNKQQQRNNQRDITLKRKTGMQPLLYPKRRFDLIHIHIKFHEDTYNDN